MRDDAESSGVVPLASFGRLSSFNFSKESVIELWLGLPAPAPCGITKFGIGGGTGLFFSVRVDEEEEGDFSGRGNVKVFADDEEHGVPIVGVMPKLACGGASLELYFNEGGN